MPGRSALRAFAAAALLVPALAACGDESPTEAGGPLLPGDIRTFEVILEADRYLIADTAFGGYGDVADADYLVVANDFEGAVEAHALSRFTIPRAIAVVDSNGVQRTDSMAAYIRGEIVLVLDSSASSVGPIRLEALRTAEPWHPGSTTWQLRVDTGSVQLPWTQPGGTVGAAIDVQTWDGGVADTVRFEVDSATIAAWRDTADHARGALVRSLDPNTQLRVNDFYLDIEARPSVHQDTVVRVNIRPPDPTFVYDPPVETVSSAPRIGGITAWRTFLVLRQRLDTLRVPCPDEPGCTLPLRDAAISYGALLLEPAASAPGYSVQDSLALLARIVLDAPGVPLARSVLGQIAGQLEPSPASRFGAGADAVELPITDYLRLAAVDTATDSTVPQRITLLPAIQSGTFGYASFQAMPRLRLVLSVASELQLR